MGGGHTRRPRPEPRRRAPSVGLNYRSVATVTSRARAQERHPRRTAQGCLKSRIGNCRSTVIASLLHSLLLQWGPTRADAGGRAPMAHVRARARRIADDRRRPSGPGRRHGRDGDHAERGGLGDCWPPPWAAITTSPRPRSSAWAPASWPTRSACGTPSTPTTSRPSTTRPASSSARANGRCRSASSSRSGTRAWSSRGSAAWKSPTITGRLGDLGQVVDGGAEVVDPARQREVALALAAATERERHGRPAHLVGHPVHQLREGAGRVAGVDRPHREAVAHDQAGETAAAAPAATDRAAPPGSGPA